MYPSLKEVYFKVREMFPMLPAWEALRQARHAIALRESLLAKVRANKACSGFAAGRRTVKNLW